MKSGYPWFLLLALLVGCGLLLACCGVAPTESLSPVGTPPEANTATAPAAGSGRLQGTPTPLRPEEAATAEPTQVEEKTMDDSPDPQVAGLIEQAREDLSARLQIEAGSINLESVEAVQWRDSSLGCPQPGRSYLTVITPGFQIILSAGGKEYDYRTDFQRALICEP